MANDYTNEQLVQLIRDGQAQYAAQLIAQNTGFIRAVVRRYETVAARVCADIDDLMQAGAEGLLLAVGAYDPDRAPSFTTIAALYIKKCARELLGLRSSRRSIEVLGLSVSLESEIPGAESLTPADLVEDPAAENAFEAVEVEELRRTVREEIEKLPEPEKSTVKRIGLYGLSNETVRHDLGISRQRVSQIYHAGLKKLRRVAKLRELYQLCGPCYHTRGASTFFSTRTSDVEAEAIRRENIKNRARRLIDAAYPVGDPNNDDIRAKIGCLF